MLVRMRPSLWSALGMVMWVVVVATAIGMLVAAAALWARVVGIIAAGSPIEWLIGTCVVEAGCVLLLGLLLARASRPDV
jgi:hypothetical protein